MTSLYQKTSQNIWKGREDGVANERLFQVIECVDIESQPSLQPAANKAYAILGFACDQGVIRNQGRPGAKDGPAAIRQKLASLPIHKPITIIDTGDIVCQADLAMAQQQLADRVAQVLASGYKPLIFGGGHEVAWGHFQGLAQAGQAHDIGIINFDAHFDLRPVLADGHGSSGTPFQQIATYQQACDQAFNYLCLGIQPLANTQSLFRAAEKLGCQYVLAEDFYLQPKSAIMAEIQRFIDAHRAIYLTVCLDVFSSAYAPGVSAPQTFGLTPQQVLFYLRMIADSGKVISMDIAEMCPIHDQDGVTAALAAQLVMEYLSL